MTQVVYADILVVVNIYVNYALLRLSCIVSRQRPKQWRLVLSAALGGLCSLIILIPGIPDLIFAALRLLTALLLIYAAFGFANRRQFLRATGSFFLVNFIFAGLMFGVWLFISPKSMLFSGGIVYFDIDALTLVVLTIICYAIVSGIHAFVRFKAPHNIIYDMDIHAFGKTYRGKAMLDTGNTVTEPFSSLPVVIVDSSLTADSGSQTLGEAAGADEHPPRYISCASLGGGALLAAYRPDKLHIKGLSGDFDTDEVYIALTQSKIKNGDYCALLNPAIFENK